MNQIKNCFFANGFEWFRRNYPMILTQANYNETDKQKYISAQIDESLKQKLENIRKEVYDQLPFDNLDMNDSIIYSLYIQRTDWWLRNFKL